MIGVCIYNVVYDAQMVQLTAMNDSLYEHPLASKAAQHTRQRHRDILRGYRQEFAKIEENHRMRVERESLLEDGGNGGAGGSSSHSSGLSRRDMYLKENQHVQKYAISRRCLNCCLY